MRSCIIFLYIFFISVTCTVYAQCGNRYQNNIVFDKIDIRNNIQYGSAITSSQNNKNLYLDFYEPAGDTAALRPLLIFLHGGSFLDGSKNIQETILPCTEMAMRGYTVAAVAYRTEDNVLAFVFKDIMHKAVIRATQDARAAIRFFYKQAKEDGNPYRIDTNQIFLGGVSAGAITAVQTAYLDNINEADQEIRGYINSLGGLEGHSGNEGYSSRVKGVINIGGCISNRNYVNNNKDIPILNIQYTNDILVPSYYGRPYNIPTLPLVMGSYVIANQMNTIGIYNMNYMLSGKGHVPYIRDAKKIQPNFDSTMYYMSRFMFSLLECNPGRVITSQIRPGKVSELNIYPNPSSGYLILGQQTIDLTQVSRIRIIDMLGRIIYEERYDFNNNLIDLQHLPFNNCLLIVEALDSDANTIAQQRIVFKR